MNTMLYAGENAGEIKEYYDQLCPAYREAFSGPPWYEVSKCVGETRQCEGGYSSVSVGELCPQCDACPTQAAYRDDELIARFDEVTSTRAAAWYLEFCEDTLALAALAWAAKPERIVAEKYADVPAMADWLPSATGNEPIVWLDEVFANKNVRSRGNLRNFGAITNSLAQVLGVNRMAYRTITPQMLIAGQRTGFTIFSRQGERPATLPTTSAVVPDRRDFLIADMGGSLS